MRTSDFLQSTISPIRSQPLSVNIRCSADRHKTLFPRPPVRLAKTFACRLPRWMFSKSSSPVRVRAIRPKRLIPSARLTKSLHLARILWWHTPYHRRYRNHPVEPGHCAGPHSQAPPRRRKPSKLFMHPGGILTCRRVMWPCVTASKCSQIAPICQLSENRTPGSRTSQAHCTKPCSRLHFSRRLLFVTYGVCRQILAPPLPPPALPPGPCPAPRRAR